MEIKNFRVKCKFCIHSIVVRYIGSYFCHCDGNSNKYKHIFDNHSYTNHCNGEHYEEDWIRKIKNGKTM